MTTKLHASEPRVSVSPSHYVSYRGGSGMSAWLLHRVTGLGVLVFVFLHVIDTALIGWGPSAYNEAIALYRKTGFRIGEIVLVGAVLYHALNGIRITIMDFWPATTIRQKELFYGVIGVFIVLYVPTVFVMVEWMLR